MKRIFLLLVFCFLLASCATPTSVPTAMPSLTPAPPTAAPTATLTPTPNIPAIDIDGVQVPDPKVANPELFDLKNPDSPIVQFANAFSLRPEEVLGSLHAEMEQPEARPAFAVIRTADGVAVLMAQQDLEKKWEWKEATAGSYWAARGKMVGFYVRLLETNYMNAYLNISKFAEGGILAGNEVTLGGHLSEVLSGNEDRFFGIAHDNDMPLWFHYVTEPGRFPTEITGQNVDEWLAKRLSYLADEILKNKSEQPVFLSFNEAWAADGIAWNPDPNPLRDRYGDKWLEEYLYQAISIPLFKALLPNRDFIVAFNEADLISNHAKQKPIHERLQAARSEAFGRLTSDASIATQLAQMNIRRPEDIQVWLGAQMHVKLNPQANPEAQWFRMAPTRAEINVTADTFGDLGGLMLTEFNPNGTDEEKTQFLAATMNALYSNQNLRGLILWNMVPPALGGNDVYRISPTVLFDGLGHPKQLYFELLRKPPEN